MRGSAHVVNTNSCHIKARIKSKKRSEAREKLTSCELFKIAKESPHKAKIVHANQAQKEAEQYFAELVINKFYSFKRSKIQDLKPIRGEIQEKVFERFKDHPEIMAIKVYIKNLWVVFDKHLFILEGIKEKVDHHINLIIKNTNQERINSLLNSGATPHEVYCTLRKVHGANLYRIGILADRGSYLLKVYIEKRLRKLLKYHFNNFKNKMSSIGITTGKDFFLITRRHLPFLFNEKYKSLYQEGPPCYFYNVYYVISNTKETIPQPFRLTFTHNFERSLCEA
ncbi:MAG: hypothetical protein ACR5K6_03525 [Wolbachia sp.]